MKQLENKWAKKTEDKSKKEAREYREDDLKKLHETMGPSPGNKSPK